MIGFNTNLALNDVEIDVLISQPQGAVGRWLRRKGREMEAAAKRDVGVKTGRLQRSIYRTHERVAKGQKMVIGARARHAFMHHEGTTPHFIFGEVGNELVFVKYGAVIRTRYVRHPGTKPNKFLTKQFIFLKTP